MPGTVNIEYDSERNIVFTVDNWDIKNQADVDEFYDEHAKKFEAIGKKIYMISNIDNLSIHPSVLEYYGATARRKLGHYILGFARWGTNEVARMSIRTSSMKAHLESHIYQTREEAIQYIEELKKSAPADDGRSTEPEPVAGP
jgi:hypothetical protein